MLTESRLERQELKVEAELLINGSLEKQFQGRYFSPVMRQRDAIECLQREISHREKATENNKVKCEQAEMRKGF